jgi:dTDP-4-amino-4,6-dideoxygalactose transaminase
MSLHKGAFPLAEALADTVLSLPMGPHVSLQAIDQIAAAVRAYMLRSGGE